MKTELTLSALAGMLSLFKYATLGQAETAGIPALVTQFGGLGLAIWLVIHHTMITIPTMQKLHREERTQDLELFKQTLNEKLLEHSAELDRQRQAFLDGHCKYVGCNNGIKPTT